MPNWCENRLEVSGPERELKKFDLAFKGQSPKWGVAEYETWNKTDEEVKKIKEEYERDWATENRYTFNSFVPVPQEVINTGYSVNDANISVQTRLSATNNKDQWLDGYSWCISHWGTKWDIGEVVFTDNGFFFQYEFDTAWSPPLVWLESTAKQFPNLRFTLYYYEEGMCFAGHSIFNLSVGIPVQFDVERTKNEEEYFAYVLQTFGYDIPAIEEEWANED